MFLPKYIFFRLLFSSFVVSLFLIFFILNSKFFIPEVAAADWTFGADGLGNFVVKDRTTGVVKFQIDVNGAITTSRLNAANVSSGNFGSNTGGGNYTFPGDVGIGTTGPIGRLDIAGDSNRNSPLLNLISTGAFGGGEGYDKGLLISVSNAAANSSLFNIKNSGASQFYVRNDGNVGIGTTSPNLKLDLLGTIGTPATSGTTQTGIVRMTTSGNGTLDFGFGTGAGAGWLQATNKTNLSANYSLLLNPNGGYIGIGTNNPQSILDVRSATNARITINRAGSWGTSPGDIKFNTDDLGTNYWTFGMQPDSSNNFRLRLNSSEYLTVLTSGNVGIGTAAPAAKLDVAGTTSTISNAAGNIIIAPASGTLQITGKTKESGVKAWYVGFTNGPSFGAGAWNNVGPSLAFTSDGGPLLISWDFSTNGGSHVTCQVAVDGVWPGTAAGYPETGSPYWHEGLSYANAGWQRISKSKVYRGIAAGNHTAQGQCATDGGTLAVCNAGSVGCSISVVQLQGT